MRRRPTSRVHESVRSLPLLGAVVVLLGVSGAVAASSQQIPVFRTSVDLVAVDVQVVDGTGTPIEMLTPEDFEVEISGKRRRIESVEFIRSTEADGTSARPADLQRAGSDAPTAVPASRPGRMYILAFDVGSMAVGDSRAIVQSAQAFIDRLLPSDLVGLRSIPVGPNVDPTTDHATVRRALGTVMGSRSNAQGFDSQFNLSPSEVIDITAESVHVTPFAAGGGGGRGASMMQDLMVFGNEGDAIRSVQMRRCTMTEVHCADEIRAEAMAIAFLIESRAIEGLNSLRLLVRLLSGYEGRKTVVMFSSGMPTTDRPGGRPDLGTLPTVLGRDAAATNTTIYTVHVDSSQMRTLNAATGRASGSMGSRTRDFEIEGQILDQFSGASGGALLRLTTGSGEYALNRVLRETSSHYLLGVEPEESDRDGTLRDLRVKVHRDGATVRSRQWVVVPKRDP